MGRCCPLSAAIASITSLVMARLTAPVGRSPVHRPRSIGPGNGNEPGPLVLPVLERMVRTMRNDPTRLLALDPLVRDLSADGVLDERFIDLWSALLEIAMEPQVIDHG